VKPGPEPREKGNHKGGVQVTGVKNMPDSRLVEKIYRPLDRVQFIVRVRHQPDGGQGNSKKNSAAGLKSL
jgi:hypothetical protein